MAAIDYANDKFVIARADGTVARLPVTTLGSAMQPGAYGLGKLGTTSGDSGTSPLLTDLDDATTASGLYRATTTTTGVFPDGAASCTVFFERYSVTWAKQTLTYRGDNASKYNNTYVRTYNYTTSSWRPWQKIAFVSDLPADIIAAAINLTAN